MHTLLGTLSAYDQKAVFDTILRDLARKFLHRGVDIVGGRESLMKNASTISGVAAMVGGLAQSNALLEAHIIYWLTSTTGEYAGLGLETRRALIATLASSQGELPQVLHLQHANLCQTSLSKFWRRLYRPLETEFRFSMMRFFSRSVSELCITHTAFYPPPPHARTCAYP
jgi:hypothetical protein